MILVGLLFTCLRDKTKRLFSSFVVNVRVVYIPRQNSDNLSVFCQRSKAFFKPRIFRNGIIQIVVVDRGTLLVSRRQTLESFCFLISIELLLFSCEITDESAELVTLCT